MKLIIEIPDELANKEHWYTDKEIWTVIKAAQNGTPIPDNATNGDVIKAMFDEEDIWDIQTALNTHSETTGWWDSLYCED